MGPGGWRDPKDLPYALDNGRFSVWSKGKKWSRSDFQRLIWSSLESGDAPQWIAVPDVVTEASETLDWWHEWKHHLKDLQVPLALVVQDGMTPEIVKREADPDVIFVGGTASWKRRTLWNWCREFPRVHVGRVNTERWLWHAHRCGAESCDGTGWFRGNQEQLAGLLRYLDRSSSNEPMVVENEYAACFRNEPKLFETDTVLD